MIGTLCRTNLALRLDTASDTGAAWPDHVKRRGALGERSEIPQPRFQHYGHCIGGGRQERGPQG